MPEPPPGDCRAVTPIARWLSLYLPPAAVVAALMIIYSLTLLAVLANLGYDANNAIFYLNLVGRR
jgi:hypothetical protein